MTPDTNDAVVPDPLDPDGGDADRDEAEPVRRETEADKLFADIDLLQRERDDLLDTSQRLQADFENYRKRVLREQTALVERATEGLVEQLLPVLDSFELALANFDVATSTPSRCARESSSCTPSCSVSSNEPASSASTRSASRSTRTSTKP